MDDLQTPEIYYITGRRICYVLVLSAFYPTNASNIPAATALPNTPATFGPIACISKKLWGLASSPTLFTTRAAIGTAETPAAPTRGLMVSLLRRFINFAMSTPAAVPIENATAPSAKIPMVSTVKNSSDDNFDPTAKPKNIVTTF